MLKSLLNKRFNSSSSFKYQVPTYNRPSDIIITSGKGVYLYDSINNKKYLDFTAGIAVTALGHNDAQIAKIISDQVQPGTGLIHSSNLYYNKPSLDLGIKIVDKTVQSGGMHDAKQVFFCNSGTEANEAAIKFCIKYQETKLNKENIKYRFLALKNSFHGRSLGALAATYNFNYRKPYLSSLMNVDFIDIADLSTLKDSISKAKSNGEVLAGCIVEPIQGEGGINPIPSSLLIELKKTLTSHDIPLVYDEIQSGVSRSGKLWTHSHYPQEAHPDAITFAKGMGNGVPIGGIIVNDKFTNVIKAGDHGTTFGGNPLVCAVANHVIERVTEEDFLKNVEKNGEYLQQQLQKKFVDQYSDICVAVKGKGLMVGLEFKEPPKALVKQCQENGLLVITAGKSTLRFVPALNIKKEEIDEGLVILENAFKKIYQK
ncbi:Acetylornithine aminotransferase, mitochondrial [Hanseniaspora uvarum DSM 2768]|nr:Acetylornithine aminotransferase, mitochondrial [Hanseniaspora uvarum DSM 2768]